METSATTTSRTSFTRASDRELRATHVVDAPIELVWAAHTECDHIREWQLGPDDWSMTR